MGFATREFWNALRRLVSRRTPREELEPEEIEARVRAFVERSIGGGAPFTARDAAEAAMPDSATRTVAAFTTAYRAILVMQYDGMFRDRGYTRTWRRHLGGNWVYHPMGYDVSQYEARTEHVRSEGTLLGVKASKGGEADDGA